MSVTSMMKAVLFPGDRKVVVEDRPIPEPHLGEVLVQTKASAICRSDMGLYSGTSAIVGSVAAGSGLVVPGHEPAGVVAAVGAGVTSLQPGDRVSGYLPVGCGHCQYCASGYLMLCPQWKCLGFDIDGGDAEYFVLPERNCLPLPDSCSFVAGALMTDMIGSQYHVQRELGVRGGQTVTVVGLGPMGAAAVLVATALGARVIAVDLLPARLELAAELGAAQVVDSSREDAAKAILDYTRGVGTEAAIDCSGVPAGQNLCLDVAAKRGAVAFVGESRSTEINPSDQIIRKLLTVVGGWYFPLGDWHDIVRLVVGQQLPIEKLVTHTFALEQASDAFAAFDRRETEKAVFVWD